MTEATWHKYDSDDAATCPPEPGNYAVMVLGDSESEDGIITYEYPDYQTFAWLNPSEEGEQPVLRGVQGEEPEHIFAWYGPITIPAYDHKTVA